MDVHFSVIHFGRSCLTPTQRLPVLNIFTILPLNTDTFNSSMLQSEYNPFSKSSNISCYYSLAKLQLFFKNEFCENTRVLIAQVCKRIVFYVFF